MRIRLANLCWIIVAMFVACGVIYAVLPAQPDVAARKAVAETRLALRQQGFKTDLTDFNFSTTPGLRAREAVLNKTVPSQSSGPPFDWPSLMETVGAHSAIVVWKQNSLKRQYPSWPGNSYKLTWGQLGNALNENRPALDAACTAIMSGPIRFNLNATAGNAMLLPYLAMLKNLTQMLDGRTMLALHDGNQDDAWTNLMTATRLVTAWEPRPVEVSCLVRFGITKLVFNTTWQALQAGHWPDDQLGRLQAEWESANFLTNLPEIAAFKCACDVASYQQDRHEVLESRPPLVEFIMQGLRYPMSIWDELQYRWIQGEYLRHGMYEDEKQVMLFYHRRELELRRAVQSPTWEQMRQLPGVTNGIFFQSKYPSRVQSMINLHQISMGYLRQGSSLLGRAAEAEAERRILVVAIALERYREKQGTYPQTLAALTPEFLKTVPADFMDGQPLHYRLEGNGHFLLYSVGQDCVDNGGKIRPETRNGIFPRPVLPGEPSPKVNTGSDIVWPLSASSGGTAALRRYRSELSKLVAPGVIRRKHGSSDLRLKKLFKGQRGLSFTPTEKL